MTEPRPQVYWPRPVQVRADGDGAPLAGRGVAVEAVREEWLVEDRWWTPKPLRRRYFELVLADGATSSSSASRRSRSRRRWFEQRA